MSDNAQGTVVTYGTFDLFHKGHVALLRRARALGGRLLVGLSTDDFNAVKGKVAAVSYADRKLMLEACRYVDGVFPERDWAQKRADILRFGAQVFVMGDDWRGQFDGLSDLCEVVYLSRTPNVSSTQIKANLAISPARAPALT